MLEGSFYLPLPANKTPDYCGVARGDHKVTSIRTETGFTYWARKRDGSFFPPLPVNTLPYFGGVKVKSCHKVTSIGAEAETSHPTSSHPIRMLNGGFFSPLPSNTLPDFGGVIISSRGGHNVIAIGAEDGIIPYVIIRVMDSTYILAGQMPCFC